MSDAAPQMTYFAFAFADVFPADDPLSEWLTTLALAMNDIALVHVRLEEDQDSPEKFFYWNRLAVSHFTEIGRFLNDTRDIPEIKAFVDSLPEDAKTHYAGCTSVWDELRPKLFRTRNRATFHYPDLRTAASADRPMRAALEAVNADRGVIRAGRIRDARALFADDLVASIFGDAIGGFDQIEAFESRVVDGTTGFIRFTNLALDEHLARLRTSGVVVEEVAPVDPTDIQAGWKVVAHEWPEVSAVLSGLGHAAALTACDYAFVIHVYGQGDPRHLFHLVDHHAQGVGDLVAPIAVVLIDVLGRDDQRHEVHIGGGWNSVNLYLANGEKIALRARTTAGRYDHLDVHRGSINPLGPLDMEIRDAMGIARFHRSLAKWAKP